jgi:hypothetical protein
MGYRYDIDESLREMLDDAELNASTDWEMEFVDGIKLRYQRYGETTILSDKQLETLRRIAGLD